MTELDDSEPPDRGGGSSRSKSKEPKPGEKRPIESQNDAIEPVGKKVNTPSASIQHIYVRPGYENDCDIKYTTSDTGPFIVHVSRDDSDQPNTTTRMRALKMAQTIYNGKVAGIKEIKSIGKNKMSIYFLTALDANAFLDHPVLTSNNLRATIPRFQVSRMGVVRQIPLDWTLEELADNIECPSGVGPVIKARRLNSKKLIDGKRVWEPTGTVVLTFLAQNLPDKVYCFSMSISVDPYRLPIIQCHKCCRFGHIRDQCRSNPRCARCAQNHESAECRIPEAEISCLFCSGPHSSTDPRCPEFSRQRSIKLIMSEENIGYVEAARRFRPVRTSYADKTNNSSQATQVTRPLPMSPPMSQQSQPLPMSPPRSQQSQPPTQSQSYRKTVYIPRHPRPEPGKSYDRSAHNDIIYTPTSTQPNGCALGQGPSVTPNDNLADLLSQMMINLLSKFADIIPYTVLESLQGQISAAISKYIQDNQLHGNTMEY